MEHMTKTQQKLARQATIFLNCGGKALTALLRMLLLSFAVVFEGVSKAFLLLDNSISRMPAMPSAHNRRAARFAQSRSRPCQAGSEARWMKPSLTVPLRRFPRQDGKRSSRIAKTSAAPKLFHNSEVRTRWARPGTQKGGEARIIKRWKTRTRIWNSGRCSCDGPVIPCERGASANRSPISRHKAGACCATACRAPAQPLWRHRLRLRLRLRYHLGSPELGHPSARGFYRASLSANGSG